MEQESASQDWSEFQKQTIVIFKYEMVQNNMSRYINKKEKQKTPVGTVQALTLKKQIHVHDCSLSWLGTGT
jgi:hypothetical protein